MSNALDALLSREINTEKQVYIEGIGTNFTVKSLTNAEVDEITDESTRKIGKGSNQRTEYDEQKANALTIVRGCKDPQFADKQVLEAFGATSADEAVRAALKPGEFQHLIKEILELSGINMTGESYEEEVDEIKNG
ncbi:phage tail assembly chaperone [Salibacterium lacus]|uniref:XkdN-like protein n=1 Tax=Salibacterium lacus TaxID=1898109 RepID=A0ABW5SZA0_9BACI